MLRNLFLCSKFLKKYNFQIIPPTHFYFSTLPKQTDLEYCHLTAFLTKLSQTSSRKLLTEELKNYFANNLNNLDNETNINLMRLITGKFHDTKKMFLGEKMLIDVLASVFRKNNADIDKDLRIKADIGELGRVYFMEAKENFLLENKEAKHLTINEIIGIINEMLELKSKNIVLHKKELIIDLCKRCKTGEEIAFIFKILLANLRIGFTKKTVFTAIESIPKTKEVIDYIQQLESNVFGRVLELKIKDQKEIVTPDLKIGIPLSLMGGRPAGDISNILEMFKKFDGNILCEVKYDGERSQIHFDKETDIIQCFSRNFENHTDKNKNLLNELKTHLISIGIEKCILDCELVGYDYEKKELLSFQDSRKNKIDPTVKEGKIYIFDLLELNGRSLLNYPLGRRKLEMKRYLKYTEFFDAAEFIELTLTEENKHSTEGEILKFLTKSIIGNFEGIMIKTLDSKLSIYNPISKVQWIKLKKNVLAGGLPDTLDLIPIGAYYGKGKREGIYGSYILGAYNDEEKKFETVCKIGTGFTEELLNELTNEYKENIYPEKPAIYDVPESLKPDVWLKPAQVWEIASDSFSFSDLYTIGKKKIGRGISLRFPRLSKIRTDKSLNDATRTEDIEGLCSHITKNVAH